MEIMGVEFRPIAHVLASRNFFYMATFTVRSVSTIWGPFVGTSGVERTEMSRNFLSANPHVFKKKCA